MCSSTMRFRMLRRPDRRYSSNSSVESVAIARKGVLDDDESAIVVDPEFVDNSTKDAHREVVDVVERQGLLDTAASLAVTVMP